MRSATPRPPSSSSVRGQTRIALDALPPGRPRSTIRTDTPRRSNSPPTARPTGPPPTIRTCAMRSLLAQRGDRGGFPRLDRRGRLAPAAEPLHRGILDQGEQQRRDPQRDEEKGDDNQDR